MTISDDILKQQKADDEQHTPPSLVDQFRAALISAGFKPEICQIRGRTEMLAWSKSYRVAIYIEQLPNSGEVEKEGEAG